MQERRKYVRLNVCLDVSYTIEGREGSYYKSITRNISPNGARFAVIEQLPKGTVLCINIKIPTRTEPIPVKARIVWSKKEDIKQKDMYDTGLEFIQISDEGKRDFLQYLCNLMYEQLMHFE